MYFVKLPPAAHEKEYLQPELWTKRLYVKCSRGYGYIRKRPGGKWYWEVKYETKDPKTKNIKMLQATGEEEYLARAGRFILQRLFSQRTWSLTELMRLLVQDQVMYELATIGEQDRRSY
jgi:hypothetical protein